MYNKFNERKRINMNKLVKFKQFGETVLES